MVVTQNCEVSNTNSYERILRGAFFVADLEQIIKTLQYNNTTHVSYYCSNLAVTQPSHNSPTYAVRTIANETVAVYATRAISPLD